MSFLHCLGVKTKQNVTPVIILPRSKLYFIGLSWTWIVLHEEMQKTEILKAYRGPKTRMCTKPRKSASVASRTYAYRWTDTSILEHTCRCIHVRLHVSRHACIDISKCAYICLYAYIYLRGYLYVHFCICVWNLVCLYIFVSLCVCMCIRITF